MILARHTGARRSRYVNNDAIEMSGQVAVCAGSDLMRPLGALLTGAVFVWLCTLAQY